VPVGDPTPTPRPAWEIEYEKVLEAALAEGEIVIAMGGSASRNFAPRFAAFEKETGIKVIAATGRGSQQVEKIRSEREAGVFSTDIWMTGTTSTKKVNAVGALKDNFLDHIILPDIADPKNWLDGKHQFPNGLENTTLTFCASPNVAFAYNTNLLDISTLDSYWDLLDDRFRGQIIGILPWEPGQTDGEFYINTPALGKPFMDKLILDMDVEYVADGQQGVDALAAGVYTIFMPTGNASDDIDELQEQGFPVANSFGEGMIEGGVLGIGGACSASLLKDPPHPNAQKIFVNWWYSAENLYEAGGITNDHALRLDVPTDNILPQYLRKPGVTYFFPETDPSVDPNNPGLAYAREIAEANGLR
jgi:iron(III) transport system substrate-binding protein